MSLQCRPHVTVQCSAYNVHQQVMMPDTKRLLLAGKTFEGGESKEMRVQTDTIVKQYLKAVNDWRKEVKGLPDMRGTHMWVPECTLEEEMQCEQDASEAQRTRQEMV